MRAAIDGELCPANSGQHRWDPVPVRDAVRCLDCRAVVSGVDFALAESRRRIELACTEPGNAPAGAPYPFNPDAEEAPTMQTTMTTVLVTSLDQLNGADRSACRTTECSAPIVWALSSKGTRSPIDLTPDGTGNIILEVLEQPDPRTGCRFKAHVLGPSDVVDPEVLRFTSHFATCAFARDYRRPRS